MRVLARVITLVVGVGLFVLPFTRVSFALEQKSLIINEVQTASVLSASEEFIELFNLTEDIIALDGWQLQYSSASSIDWSSPSRTISLTGRIGPLSHYLITSSGYLSDLSDQIFAPGLAKAGGHLRLIKIETNSSQQTTTTFDEVGWGTAQHPETASAFAPEEGQSIERVVDQSSALPVDTDDNSLDFVGIDTPTPTKADQLPVEEEDPEDEPPQEEEEEGDPAEEPEDDPEQVEDDEEVVPVEEQGPNDGLFDPLITELLPDPADPDTDANDEFVEIYNPNATEFDLTGYMLQTGSSFSYKHAFAQGVKIAPNSYLLVYSKDTNITLSNSGGDARLVDPGGVVVGTITPYSDEGLKEGYSWLVVNDVWQWSITPTPGLPNVLALPAPAVVKGLTTKTKTSTKKAPAKKKASAKKTSSSTAKKSEDKTDDRVIFEDPETIDESVPIHPLVLAGVGSLTVGYAVYEYRFEVQRVVEQLRRNRISRRTARS